ncbi:glycosyltransferase [Ideonella sp. A 288]|uniref:glycosyltransferase n=1 Tax=Ideonella sp. A 288 TaxID=1962181 RepID=UPI0013037053|nr:glycosyltransferase [Ideonella sp. A 288]
MTCEVSVLVRSMDRPSLAQALASVAAQTADGLEVVVVNAAGGHHSGQGVHCGRHTLRLINQGGAPLGRAAAANLGLASAAGRWLIFLDDDDLLDADHVARLLGALAAAPGAQVAYTGVRLVDSKGQPAGVLDEPFDDTRLWLANYLPIHAVLFARSVVDEGLRFDESLPVYEDWDFWRRLASRHAFVHLPGVSATYRLVGNSGLSEHADVQVASEGRARIYRQWLARLDAGQLDRIATFGELQRSRGLALEQQRAEVEAEVRRLAGEVQTLDGQARGLRDQVDQRDQRLRDLQRAHDALETQLRAELALNHEITHSLSWRITEPLRRARAMAQRVTPRAVVGRVARALPLSSRQKQRLKVWLATSGFGGRWLQAAAAAPVAAAPTGPTLDKEAVRAEAEAQLSAFLAGDERVRLHQGGQAGDAEPQVSVVVVLYNQAGLSLLCLRALAASRGVSFETLVVDNASSDRMPQLLARLDGATLLPQDENLGFLRAVNLAAGHAKGRHLLLLNNDAVVEPDTLAHAVARLEREPDVGAVGGPILLWDGRLQEAGSIVWRDGSCLGYGRGDSPDAPAYRFVRDVDYCSGALLMVRRELFERLGRFDDVYAPAYYEESDFCVRLWEAGHRIVCDPAVRIKHFEFASDVGSGRAMALQARNRELFVARHAGYLSARPESSPGQVLAARQILRPGARRILIVDDRVPFPQLGRGYPRAAMLANRIAAEGHAVTYYPLVFADGRWDEVHQALDERIEVILDQGVAGLTAFLAARAGHHDLMLVSRPHNMAVVDALRASHPDWFAGTRLVYDAEALFSLREAEKARVLGQPLPPAKARAMLEDELALARHAERIVAVSQDEARHYREAGCTDVVVLGHALAPQPSAPDFGARSGFLFVGAITADDCPNGDSLLWFLREVWPTVQAALGAAARLDVVGVCESATVRAMASGSVRIHGRVHALDGYFDARRVFIVPTRYAAGVPHKAHEAASRGLPMVVTPLIARQLGWADDVQVGDGPAAFAAACVRLHRDEGVWTAQRAALLAAVARDCSIDAFDRAVREIVR